jgi:hypothetical protein
MIYQQFTTTDIVAGRTQTVSSGFFNDGNYTASQAAFSTNSTQTQAFGSTNVDVQNGLYYWDVYYNSQVHFSLSYGDLIGNASPNSDYTTTKIFPFSASYQSYVNLLLSPSETQFSFLTGSYVLSSNTLTSQTVQSPSIFIINFNANLYKNQVDSGLLEFSLAGGNGVFTFIDDSSVINKNSNVYNIISGAIDSTTGIPTPYTSGGAVPYQSFGLFYPKNGIVILNALAISSVIGTMSGVDSTGAGITFSPYSAGTNFNTYQSCLYTALYSAGNTYDKPMKVRKSELIPTTQYYVRVQNGNYNYTNNPTFVSNGTDGLTRGTIKIPELRTNPTTYITTVGLYDSANELVAVAKLSQPVPKSFDNEYLLKVNLAY